MTDLDKAREEWVHYEGEESANAYLKEQQDRIAALTARMKDQDAQLFNERKHVVEELKRNKVLTARVEELEREYATANRFINRFIVHDGEAKPYSVREGQLLLEQAEARCEELERELEATEAERYRVNVQAEQAEAALAAEREKRCPTCQFEENCAALKGMQRDYYEPHGASTTPPARPRRWSDGR